MASNVWTPAVLNKMKTFLSRGLSTAEIGKKIGMSKNAVVGKLNRLGWNAKSQANPKNKVEVKKTKPASPVKKKPTKTETPAKKASDGKKTAQSVKVGATPKGKTVVTVVKPAPKVPTIKSNSKTLAMHQRIIQHSLEMAALRPDQCRWPIGDPDSESFHFCGKQAFVGKPYCYEHCLQAYQMQPPKKK